MRISKITAKVRPVLRGSTLKFILPSSFAYIPQYVSRNSVQNVPQYFTSEMLKANGGRNFSNQTAFEIGAISPNLVGPSELQKLSMRSRSVQRNIA